MAANNDHLMETLLLLRQDEFRSGEWMAEQLGISRAAVWKRVESLRASGIRVETRSARGYRLLEHVEALDARLMLKALHSDIRGRLSGVTVLQSVDSTNRYVLEGLSEGRVGYRQFVFAERQTAGRGRRGRGWVSPFARNLNFSFAWEFESGVAALSGLSLVAGVAVANALHSVGVAGALLKWPNDIVVDGAKLGGILVELDGDCEGPIAAIIGIGLNFDIPAEQGVLIDQEWTDIKRHCGDDISRNAVAAALIVACVHTLDEFRWRGFSHFRDQWNELDALRGRQLEVRYGSGPIYGCGAGVDETGALLLAGPDGCVAINGGEVSVRPQR